MDANTILANEQVNYNSDKVPFIGCAGEGNNVIVKQQLIQAVALSDEIECLKTPDEYFKELYKLFIKEEFKLNQITPPSSPQQPISLNLYLKMAECSLVNEMFRRVCSKLKKKDVLSKEKLITIDEIKPNDVISIRCPSFNTGYHYLFAVVNNLGNRVTIYQSFGYNKSLHLKDMTLTNFKRYLNNIKIIQDSEILNNDVFNLIKNIEKNLYFKTNFEETLFTEDDMNEDESYRYDILVELFNIYKNYSLVILAYSFLKSDCQESRVSKKRSRVSKDFRVTKRPRLSKYSNASKKRPRVSEDFRVTKRPRLSKYSNASKKRRRVSEDFRVTKKPRLSTRSRFTPLDI